MNIWVTLITTCSEDLHCIKNNCIDCQWQSITSMTVLTVKLLRSPSDCQDPVWSKIDPLPLPQLHSNHPLRFQHYTNHSPEPWLTPKTSDTLSSSSKTPKRPPKSPTILLSPLFCSSLLALQSHFHISVFIFPFSIYYTVSVLLYSCSSLCSTISTSLPLKSCNPL